MESAGLSTTNAANTHSSFACSDPYAEGLIIQARRCRGNGLTQQALEISAHLAIYTSSPDDLAFMRRCADSLIALRGVIYADTAAKVTQAYVKGLDIDSAARIATALRRREINSKVVATWMLIYSISRNRVHLEKARAIANRMPPEDAAIAYAEIFAQSCEEPDRQACLDILDNTVWHPKRAEETMASTAVSLARNGLTEDAVDIFRNLTLINPRFRAATAIAMETRDPEHMSLVIRLARSNPEFRFAGFRRLVRMIAACGDSRALRSLCQNERPGADNEAERCYALSFLAAIVTDLELRYQIMDKAESIATELGRRTETENAPMSLAAYAWALARSGNYKGATEVARMIRTPMRRCIAYLAIAEAQAELDTIFDLGL